MKISGQDNREFWVKGEKPARVFIPQLIKLKAGTKCELTDSCRSPCTADFGPLKDNAGGAAKCTGDR